MTTTVELLRYVQNQPPIFRRVFNQIQLGKKNHQIIDISIVSRHAKTLLPKYYANLESIRVQSIEELLFVKAKLALEHRQSQHWLERLLPQHHLNAIRLAQVTRQLRLDAQLLRENYHTNRIAYDLWDNAIFVAGIHEILLAK